MKQRIINYLFHRLLNVVVLEDVIRHDKTGIYLGNNLISKDELRQLSAEAKALEGFRIWHIMNETLRQDALNRGWNNSKTMDDLNAGKTIFYTLDLQNSIIRLLKRRDVV